MLEGKVDDCSELVLGAGLEEHVLHVGKQQIKTEAFRGNVAESVVVDLEIADGLLSLEVRLHNHVLKHLFLTLDHVQLVTLRVDQSLLFLVAFLVLHLCFFDKIFNLLLSLFEVVVLSFLVSVLKG